MLPRGAAASWTSKTTQEGPSQPSPPSHPELSPSLTLLLLPSRRSRILDIKTLEEDPGAAQEFARSKASARKEGLTGVEFKDIAGLDPILGEVLEVRGGGLWGGHFYIH